MCSHDRCSIIEDVTYYTRLVVVLFRPRITAASFILWCRAAAHLFTTVLTFVCLVQLFQ